MTREEQIIREFTIRYPRIDQNSARYYFSEGAKWADANRWISIKDELPDNPKNCHLIIKYKNDGTLFSDSFIGMYNGEKWLVLSSKRWKELPEAVQVTHYSPFPESPKFDK